MVKVHKIKILPQYFDAVQSRIKTAEVRVNDRAYKAGDWLILEEWNGSYYTGFYIKRRVRAVYELDTMGLNGYVLICME